MYSVINIYAKLKFCSLHACQFGRVFEVIKSIQLTVPGSDLVTKAFIFIYSITFERNDDDVVATRLDGWMCPLHLSQT